MHSRGGRRGGPPRSQWQRQGGEGEGRRCRADNRGGWRAASRAESRAAPCGGRKEVTASPAEDVEQWS
ncbi:hypothetical protein AV530_000718 [Patagioenas fasciata monilis]|uniref:Uncharacterized protein n=1 Tax=Patagioenas fasciata monilis TaxID=372326 RepID=A0A1V4J6W6_PATFA|nr:hypothetical protein AV530_000718 [Patagioenas fasciata monilis]